MDPQKDQVGKLASGRAGAGHTGAGHTGVGHTAATQVLATQVSACGARWGGGHHSCRELLGSLLRSHQQATHLGSGVWGLGDRWRETHLKLFILHRVQFLSHVNMIQLKR